jgi:hypothetical protein
LNFWLTLAHRPRVAEALAEAQALAQVGYVSRQKVGKRKNEIFRKRPQIKNREGTVTVWKRSSLTNVVGENTNNGVMGAVVLKPAKRGQVSVKMRKVPHVRDSLRLLRGSFPKLRDPLRLPDTGGFKPL